METMPINGIVTIVCCTALYGMAWQKHRTGAYYTAVFLLMVAGLVLRLYTSSDLFLHEWDERYHALVAKNLLHHPLKPTLYDTPLLPYDHTNWTQNHIWLHKPPLTLWAIAGSIWLFGANELSVRLPSALLSTLGIGVMYSTVTYFGSRRAAFFVAFLYSVNGFIIELAAGRTATDHPDIFFLFFVQLAVWLSIRFAASQRAVYNILTGLSIGFAILSKWLPALIVVPLWLLLIIDSGKFTVREIVIHGMTMLLVVAAVSLPWQCYISWMFPAEAQTEANLKMRHLTETIEGQDGSIFYFFHRIRIDYGELIYLPLIWFMVSLIKEKTNFRKLSLLIWFLIPFVFFSVAKTKMPAYLLFTAPALMAITALFWDDFSQSSPPRRRWLVRLISFFLIALPVRYCLERVKPFSISDRAPEWASELKKLGDQHIDTGVLFNYPRPIEAMFYTNLTAYKQLPTPEVMQALRGRVILIADSENLPQVWRNHPQVKVVKLH